MKVSFIVLPLFIAITAIGMEKPVFEPAPLRDLAARSCIEAFDPNNAKCSVAQLELLRTQAKHLPAELQEKLKHTMLKEKAAVLEQINDAKPIKIQIADNQIYENAAINPLISTFGTMIARAMHNKIMLWDAQTRKLVTGINYRYTINHVSFADENTLIVGVLKPYNDRYDLWRTNIATQTHHRMARDLGVLDCARYLSADAMLYIAIQTIGSENRHRLLHCDKQTCIKEYSKELIWHNYALSSDAATIMVRGCPRSDTMHIHHYLYHTHRAITNTASLDELLALLMAERQQKEKAGIDMGILLTLSTSKSKRLQDIAKERYAVSRAQESTTNCLIS